MAIKVVLPVGGTVTAQSVYQWDYGRTLEIEIPIISPIVISEIHFSCMEMDEALVSPCTFVDRVATVTIPNECLEQTTTITAWPYVIDGDSGYTFGEVKIPVISRQRPCVCDDIPQNIGNIYTELITEVNTAVATLLDGGVTVENSSHATNADKVMDQSGAYKSISEVLLQCVYPVGSIYMSVNNTNPSDFIGGTWVAWGAGRVPVGVDDNDVDFHSPAEKTGGAKTVQLTVQQIPSHSHSVKSYNEGLSSTTKTFIDIASVQGGGSTKNTVNTDTSGGNQSHNNLQPYITCYMWKRTQ